MQQAWKLLKYFFNQFFLIFFNMIKAFSKYTVLLLITLIGFIENSFADIGSELISIQEDWNKEFRARYDYQIWYESLPWPTGREFSNEFYYPMKFSIRDSITWEIYDTYNGELTIVQLLAPKYQTNIPDKVLIKNGVGELTMNYKLPVHSGPESLLLFFTNDNAIWTLFWAVSGDEQIVKKTLLEKKSLLIPKNPLKRLDFTKTDIEKISASKNAANIWSNISPLHIQKIASPKNISFDIKVISTNGILAFFYLIIFYFTGVLFNTLFSEKAQEFSINDWIMKTWRKIWIILLFPVRKILILLWWNSLLCNSLHIISVKYNNMLKFFGGLIFIGFIGSIIVGNTDTSILQNWIITMLLVLFVGLFSFLKDIMMYIWVLIKRGKMQVESIPVGYLLLSIIAIFVRWTHIVPGILFWSAIKFTPVSIASKKELNKPKNMLIVSLMLYTLWIFFWLTSDYLPEGSFWQTFFLSNYFSIANDIFFTLLPFSIFWWWIIISDKKYQKYWFVLMFLAIFTLFHTIFNTKWDYYQILSLKSETMNIFIGVLIFWVLVLCAFWYINFRRSSQKLVKN